MSGFAVIHRCLIGHPAFRSDAEAMAFAWLVLKASWRPTRVRYKGKAITLARGELSVSVRDLAAAMERDKGWVERLIKRLKSEAMIETRCETGVSVVTICNYDKYQALPDIRKTVDETPHETDARQTQDTEQQDNKITRNNISVAKATSVARAKKGTRLPPDWLPSQSMGEFAHCPPEAIERELRKFKDWAASAPGQKGVKLDWDATWRNWMRRANEDGKLTQRPTNQTGGRNQDRRDGVARALDRRLGIDGPFDGYPASGGSGDSLSTTPSLTDMR